MFQCSLSIEVQFICDISILILCIFFENIVKLPLIVCYMLQIFVKTIIRLGVLCHSLCQVSTAMAELVQ